MAHVSPEHLAGRALDLPEELSPDELAHLAGCALCRDELETLRAVADLGRQPDTSRVPLAPPTAVWTRITTELAAGDTRPSAQQPLAHQPSVQQPSVQQPLAPQLSTPRHAAGEAAAIPVSAAVRAPVAAEAAAPVVGPARRSRRKVALLAAAVGLVVGVGGTLGIARAVRPAPEVNAGPPVEVLARTTLAALPGKTGSGSAELLRTSTATELRVQVDTDPVASRYQELWLINTDGKRMYSLGVLPPSGAATYPLPAELAEQLQGYTIVDVSIEPYDGNAAHSHNSVVRGTLP